MLQFQKKAIKHNGHRTKVWYSAGEYTKESKLPKGTITIYAREYGGRLPKVLKPINETDLRTDYFEKDKARIKPSSKYYKEVRKLVGI